MGNRAEKRGTMLQTRLNRITAPLATREVQASGPEQVRWRAMVVAPAISPDQRLYDHIAGRSAVSTQILPLPDMAATQRQ